MTEQRSSVWVHKSDLGTTYVDPEGRRWVFAYCDRPQATFENVETGEQVTHVIGCLNHQAMGLMPDPSEPHPG